MWKKGATGEILHSMGGGGKLRKGERQIRCDNASQIAHVMPFFLPGELRPSSVQNCIAGGFPPFSPLKPSPQADAVNQTQEEEEEKRREGSFFPRGKGPPGGKKCMRTLCLPQEALLVPLLLLLQPPPRQKCLERGGGETALFQPGFCVQKALKKYRCARIGGKNNGT